MLHSFPPPPGCYLYGPVCVAETERGKGFAGRLFQVLQTHMAGRPAMTFIRADNIVSLRSHQKMGMTELGTFVSEDLRYIALSYTG
jgi:predicted GNAT family acetyltransferase